MNIDRKSINFLQSDKILESQQIFDGTILQLYLAKMQLEADLVVERELIHHEPAVAILVTAGDKTLLVEQYRAAAACQMYEIPAGIIDRKQGLLEEAVVAAQRELEEETAYRAHSWTDLGDYLVTPGYNNEAIRLFHARDLEKVANPKAQDFDEDVRPRWFTKEEIRDLLQENKLKDMKTVLALTIWLGQGGD